MNKPLIVEFRETTIFKAVILLSIISCITLALSMNLTLLISDFEDEYGNKSKKVFDVWTVLLSMIICFVSTFVAYSLIIKFFGFGKSLVSD